METGGAICELAPSGIALSSLASTESPLPVDNVRKPAAFAEAVLAVSYIGRPFSGSIRCTRDLDGSKTRAFFIVFCLGGSSLAVAPFCAKGGRFGHRLVKSHLAFAISQRMVLGPVDSWNCCSGRVSMCNSCSNGGHRSARSMELLPEACIIVQ